MNNGQPVIKCQNLAKTYDEGPARVEVLRDIELDICPGESAAIVGASGSGKSTLLHLLGGLDQPTGGEVSVLGRSMSSLSEAARGELRNRSMGFIYQFHHLLPEFTALENVAMPLLVRRMKPEQAQDAATDMLARVGLGARLAHKPGELSGGERQRAAVARALVTRPACVLADEPTGNLDRKNAEQVFELMLELQEESGASIVVVTHDAGLARRMNRVWTLEDGRLHQALSKEPG